MTALLRISHPRGGGVGGKLFIFNEATPINNDNDTSILVTRRGELM